MTLEKTLLLGFIAGVTILCGMPVGRMRRPAPTLRVMLNAVAVGILVFLVWDVLSAAWEPVDAALSSMHEGHGGLGSALGYGTLFAGGLAVGLLGLVGYETYLHRRTAVPDEPLLAIDEPDPIGGGSGRGGVAVRTRPVRVVSRARTTALLIAVGIGLHNFAEGLAIGQSAAAGEIGLATLLVIGFGLHNATEGFGIVAPLAGDMDERGERRMPSWRFLFGLAAIGGGPTFVGTIIGHGFTSEALSVIFLTLAAGSILYVVIQLIGVAAKSKRADVLAYGLLIGLVAGFLTDAVVSAAGV
jgi:ZIP family zinc transporter